MVCGLRRTVYVELNLWEQAILKYDKTRGVDADLLK